MKYIDYKGLRISKICLGSALFGSSVDKETTYSLLDNYISKGGNFIDTARVYASWLENGENKSEEIIGQYLKDRNCRDKVILATKGGHPPFSNLHAPRLSKEELEFDISESLKYLQTSYIDIYYLHRDDESRPVGEIMETLNNFVKEGKVRYLGASNWKISRIKEANKYALEHNLTPFTFSSIMYGYGRINQNGPEDDTLVIMNQKEYDEYVKEDILLVAYTSQSVGLFSKLDKGVDSLSSGVKKTYLNDVNIKRYEAIKSLNVNENISKTSLSLVGLINHKHLKVIPIIGPYRIDQLDDSLKSVQIDNKEIIYKLTKDFDF